MMHGRHNIKTWSSTQGVVALSSSGEAEYYAMIKGGIHGRRNEEHSGGVGRGFGDGNKNG